MSEVTTACCSHPTYLDKIDGGTYCSLCDRPVDPVTGKGVGR